jgi:fructokinase
MRIGIDLGGTKTEGVILSADGNEILRKRCLTPRPGSYQAILDTITTLVEELEKFVGEKCSVGIGTPGALAPNDGVLKNCNTTCLIDQPFLTDIEKHLKRPVRIENDANCFALSEAVDGAGRGFDTVFGVILGTGVGGGLVVEQKLLPGRLHISGEWGHNVLEKNGPLCYCGRQGCVETFLSGSGLAADYKLNGGADDATAEEISDSAKNQDPIAEQCIERYLERFGRALATVINIFDPHAIVLGGGLSNLERLYSDGAKRVAPHVFWGSFDTPILKNKNGDSAGVRGAAQLWPEKS